MRMLRKHIIFPEAPLIIRNNNLRFLRDFFLFLIIDFLGNSILKLFQLTLLQLRYLWILSCFCKARIEVAKFSKIFIKSNHICQQTVSSLGQSKWKTCTYDVMDVERMLSPIDNYNCFSSMWLALHRRTHRLATPTVPPRSDSHKNPRMLKQV